MSGECNFFKFYLRGENSLACKWMNQKRKTEGGLKSDGANIYAIADYIHSVFKFEKLYGKEYTSTILFNKICAINGADKDYIVKFDEAILIPLGFSPRSAGTAYSSFDEISELFAEEVLCNKKLRDILSKDEIKETLINTYHINYDLRSNENIKNKKYDEIIKGEFLDSRNNTELFFFVPYVIEIPAKEVVASSTEAPVDVALTETSVTPEVKETAVEGYFYVKDTGEYAGKNGTSENCYAVSEIKTTYSQNEITDLKIKHSDFTETCNYILHKSGEIKINKNESLWIAHSTNNAKSVKDVCGKHDTMLKQLRANGYSAAKSTVNGKDLDDNNKTERANNSRYAVMNVLLNNSDPTNNSVLWDGRDFLIKGKTHNKFKEYKRITIPYDILKKYDDSISEKRNTIFDNSISEKTDFSEDGDGKWYPIIATGSYGQSIFWKLGN